MPTSYVNHYLTNVKPLYDAYTTYLPTEIVLPLGFADTIFRRERSDDRKCVCCSQARQRVTMVKKVKSDSLPCVQKPAEFSRLRSV